MDGALVSHIQVITYAIQSKSLQVSSNDKYAFLHRFWDFSDFLQKWYEMWNEFLS